VAPLERTKTYRGCGTPREQAWMEGATRAPLIDPGSAATRDTFFKTETLFPEFLPLNLIIGQGNDHHRP
jgi:hypothetical protein